MDKRKKEWSAFAPFIGPGLADLPCEHYERTVTRDNCVSFQGKRLQILARGHRRHFIKLGCGCIATPTHAWRCSTDRASPLTGRRRRAARGARPAKRGSLNADSQGTIPVEM